MGSRPSNLISAFFFVNHRFRKNHGGYFMEIKKNRVFFVEKKNVFFFSGGTVLGVIL